ncbi:MAG TPA: Rne/Rng family ribonuclease [Candidatus Omnitrophota bacterium]|nr:Rne/Rng family ribonuclease [Candidatus Omnitrophota bacterium]HPD83990.1 Rne/Rng family ribonuclease [Candidatus Omnitrophota bacterium]HRZ02847.1 Rne/Rng family ribonuclease [Candidatus Omnitrophota bacterium]
MSKEILVSIKQGERRVTMVENGKLEDFHIEVDRQNTILGNVYKGRVESILPSINGAFVNIGEERNGFLYLTDAINPLLEEEIAGPRKLIDKILRRKQKPKEHRDSKPKPLAKGDEVLVQVVKEPFGTKGARLTTHVSLAGRFVVFMPYDKHLGVSKRIDESGERQRLREVLRELKFGQTGGFIVRTASLQKGKKELIRDAKFLFNIWQRVRKTADEKQAPALIYKEYDLMWRIVRDFLTEDVDKLIIDSQEEYHRLCRFVYTLIGREMVAKIQLYKGNVPLFDSHNVAHEMRKIYDKRVFLKSGAYVVIEPTEGLIVVDVNSGKFKANAPPEEAAFLVNMEAAPEIARQLRLRDLGGIIVIDFIDMGKESHRRRVLECLEAALSKDRSKTEVSRISALGLVEMTRARTGKTIESISFHDCPYCDGRGRVKID